MRCAVVLLALVAFGAALPQLPKQRAADQDLLKKQQDVIYLLQHISQPIPNEQLRIIGNTYDIKANYQQYENPILVKYYVGAVEAGLIQPQNTVYCNSIPKLRKEVAMYHRILLGAKNYQTFVNTAAWGRVHINEEQFVKAFIGAVLKRQDTQGITLPPLYEIVPHYYFDSRIIQEAQDIAAQQAGHVGQQQVIIPVNYTSHLPHDEYHLSYFTQDVGLANYYAYVNLAGYLLQEQQQHEHQGQVQYQQQGVGQKNHIGQGARYYYHHQQLLAHYELNRLSNGLGPIYDTDYTTVKAPYQPHLRYLNGLEFPSRPEYHHFGPAQEKLVHLVKTLQNRLFDAIDSGYVLTPQSTFLSLYQPQGLNILGELIEGTGHSVNPRYYGNLQAAARQLLGNAPEVQHIYDYTPSVLELGQIAVRDPAFYQLYKKIIYLFYRYQNSLPAYQYNDVLLPGVTIQSVQITPLTTLFNDYYVNLDAAVVHQQKQQQQGQQEQEHIKAQLKRLDHKPYEYHITVQSESNVPNVVVRTYLGPKYDYNGQPISISEYRHKFVQLDQFKTTLQQGQNVITRHSHQAPGQSFDYPSVQQIKQHVHGAARSQEPLYITEPHQIYSFPARLSLPKGTQEGYPFQLFVVISQPGQQEVHYGPVNPDQFQTYQHNEYQVIGTQEYPQQIQQQSGKTIGVKQTVEVIPEQLLTQQGNQAVRDHYANLYTQHRHGQYPFSHPQYGQVGQGQEQSVYGVPSQYGHQGHQGQQGQPEQYVQQGQYPYGQGYYQGQQGQQYQQQYPSQHKVPSHVQTSVPSVQNVQGMQHMQTVPGVQGVQGVPTGVPGVQTPVLGSQTGKYHTTYQGQSQQAQGHGVGYYGSGQYHAGGYQGISGQVQHVQDVQVSEYYQNKQIGEIIGGTISLDGKSLGYPLDRPLTVGALSVPNVHVQTVYVYHEGQPTNDIYSQ